MKKQLIPLTLLVALLASLASFGVLNPDWSPRPAWHAIQAMKKE